ncbi:MAG: NAD/NADP octopine/nopaline dehydrogenase family protein [Promethearchaeota archaeon]
MHPYVVAVLGAGPQGLAMAAYLASKGHAVNLYHRPEDGLDQTDLMDTKILEASNAIAGKFELNKVTGKISSAIRGVDIIFVCVPASVHRSLAEKMAPVLENYQVVLLCPGYVFGAIYVYNTIMETNPGITVYVGETESFIFSSRVDENGAVSISYIYKKMKYCFYHPSMDTTPYVDYIIAAMFKDFRMLDDIRKTSLKGFDAIVYPVVSLFNLGQCEKETPVLFYKDGINNEIIKIIEKLDKERCKIIEKLGLKVVTLPDWFQKQVGCSYCDYITMFRDLAGIDVKLITAELVKEYLKENVYAGLIPIAEVGNYLQIPTPLMDSIIEVCSNVYEKDDNLVERNLTNISIPEKYFSIYSSKKINPAKLVDSLCQQLLEDFNDGWLLFQATADVINVLKEYIHEATGEKISPENWRQYFYSERHSRIISVIKKTDDIKKAFQMGKEFEDFYGMIIDVSPNHELSAKPILFSKGEKREAKDFLKELKEELEKFLAEVIPKEIVDGKKEVVAKNIQLESKE